MHDNLAMEFHDSSEINSSSLGYEVFQYAGSVAHMLQYNIILVAAGNRVF